MTINEYVKTWCDEDYDVRKENFYVENAYYVAEREWASSGFKHGLFTFVFFALSILFTCDDGLWGGLLSSFVNLGILTFCFWLYGIRNYDANSMETSLIVYVMTAILLFSVKSDMGTAARILFSIPTFALFIYLTFVRPIKFIGVKRKMKRLIEEEEREEEETSKSSYAQWEDGYKAYRYGLPEPEQAMKDSDPMMAEAKKLFEGYATNKQVLKARYRQLAKIHHPDKGGSTEMFQCIIEVYERINSTLTE